MTRVYSSRLSVKMSETRCLDSAEEVRRVLQEVEYVLCDCDGVLYLSGTRIPGSDEAVHKLREAGKTVLFVTNNGAVSRATALAKLNRLGFDATPDHVFTPSYVVAQYLVSHKFSGKVSKETSNCCMKSL